MPAAPNFGCPFPREGSYAPREPHGSLWFFDAFRAARRKGRTWRREFPYLPPRRWRKLAVPSSLLPTQSRSITPIGPSSSLRARRPREGNSMAKLLALYNTPQDPAAFDAYYAEIRIPIAKKIPRPEKIYGEPGAGRAARWPRAAPSRRRTLVRRRRVCEPRRSGGGGRRGEIRDWRR